MQKDISGLLSSNELVEKVKLFEQYMLWGWKDSAYSVARDIMDLNSQSGLAVPKKYEPSYRKMEQYANEYLAAFADSGYARLS